MTIKPHVPGGSNDPNVYAFSTPASGYVEFGPHYSVEEAQNSFQAKYGFWPGNPVIYTNWYTYQDRMTGRA